MSTPASAHAPVKSAMRTLDVIEFVVAHPRGVIAQEIAAALAIPVSSLSYLLATLVERDYLSREGRRYLAGPGLERLRASRGTLPLADRVAPLVRALCSELNETSSFLVRAGDTCEALVTEAGAHALRYAIEPGSRRPMHALSAGKAILSGLSKGEFERYLADSRREKLTPYTIIDADDLRAQVDNVRATGFASTSEETTAGICGIAAPAFLNGELAGAFSIAVPKVRFDAVLEARIKALLARSVAALAESGGA